MNKEQYTSLKLSKWLQDNGCEIESEYYWNGNRLMYSNNISAIGWMNNPIRAYSYYDIIVIHAKEFFGESTKWKYYQNGQFSDLVFKVPEKHEEWENYKECNGWMHHSNEILKLLQQNKREEAEEYFKNNCIFNKNNQ